MALDRKSPPSQTEGGRPSISVGMWRKNEEHSQEWLCYMAGLVVGVGVGCDFAGEGAVDVGEIDGGEDHAKDPPDEANLQAIVGGFGVVDGEGVDGIASGQDHRVDAKDDAGQHAEKIRARGEEGVALVLAAEFEGDAGETRDSEQR